MVASCLDDENEIPLMIIALFSALRFALPSIPLIVGDICFLALGTVLTYCGVIPDAGVPGFWFLFHHLGGLQ